MADSAGPFPMGATFTLVDAAVLPFFIRSYVLKHFRGFELPAECERLKAWYEVSTARCCSLQTRVSFVPDMLT